MTEKRQGMDTFYFIIYPKGDRTKIKVVDLAYCVDYERDDFDCVNDIDFTDHEAAINYARKLSEKFGLQYELFESRYDSSLDENNNLYL